MACSAWFQHASIPQIDTATYRQGFSLTGAAQPLHNSCLHVQTGSWPHYCLCSAVAFSGYSSCGHADSGPSWLNLVSIRPSAADLSHCLIAHAAQGSDSMLTRSSRRCIPGSCVCSVVASLGYRLPADGHSNLTVSSLSVPAAPGAAILNLGQPSHLHQGSSRRFHLLGLTIRGICSQDGHATRQAWPQITLGTEAVRHELLQGLGTKAVPCALKQVHKWQIAGHRYT